MSVSVSASAPPDPLARPVARHSMGRNLLRGLVRMLVLPVFLALGPMSVASSLTHPSERGFFDFHGGLWQAGVAILHGRDPYRTAFLAHQAAIMRAGGMAVGESAKHVFSLPLYPAFANVAVVPLSLLPYWWAAALYTALSFVAMWLALRLLDVRDPRCHLAWLFSYGFLWGAALGAIGPFLVLGIAAAWRWRERVLVPGLAVATIVALKIFPWTLGAWLLLTRRYAACAVAVLAGLGLTFGAWALIGFHGLASYPTMLANATYIQEGRADSVATVGLALGASPGLAQGLALIAGIAVLGLAWWVRGGPHGDRRAFGLAVIAALLATPIVWSHYLVLLFVPIALLSPSFTALWLTPAAAGSLMILGDVIAPGARSQAAPAAALPAALICIALEALIAVALCTTAEQRARLLSRRGPAPGTPATAG